MTSGTYAVVAYLNGHLADFVQNLRARLAPHEANIQAHLTLLSPRELESPPEKLHSALRRLCYDVRPVKASLGQVESFVPVTNTVYLGVDGGAREVGELNQRLNQYGFRAEDPWPYVPHVTLARLDDQGAAAEALRVAGHEWELYREAREFMIDKLTIVREIAPGRWADLAAVPLPSAKPASTGVSSA
jgi:2'-5' RNA ligase